MPNEEERSPTEQPEEGPAETMAEDREDEAAADEAEALRQISEDELKSILAQHEMWLEARNTGYEHGQRADLISANLQGADLISANLPGADLAGANLQRANLQGADLQSANLQGAKLIFANLQGADLAGANLQGADLISANLQGARLDLANLEGAKFRGLFGFVPVTNFAGADLTGARGLTQQQLDEACGDGETKLPPGLTIEPCPDETKKSD